MILDLRKLSGATVDVKELFVGEERIVDIGGLYQFKLTGVDLVIKCLETCQQKSSSVTFVVQISFNVKADEK